MKFYVDIFEVTETCQNGNERTFRKSVYSEIFTYENGRTINNGINIRVPKAKAVLEQNHYYNIKYIESKTTDLLIVTG